MKNLKALVKDAAPEAQAEAASAGPALTRNNQPKRERPDRLNQRLIAAHFDNETFKTFKILSAEEGATTQSMVSEALELLFRKYHKPINEQLSAQARARS
jgi:hypothetical protein